MRGRQERTEGMNVTASERRYDLIVIGSGPAGQRAALQAAKLGRRVMVVERRSVLGGVCTHTGTIPSKTLREAILHLTGYRMHDVYGKWSMDRNDIGVSDLYRHVNNVIKHEITVKEKYLTKNGVSIVYGSARFSGPHSVVVGDPECEDTEYSADLILVATGTVPRHDPDIPFDREMVLDSDDILHLDRLPETMAVLGGGIVGLEYASMFAAIGVQVTLFERFDQLLPFIDREIMDTLLKLLRKRHVIFRLGEKIEKVSVEEVTVQGRPAKAVRIQTDKGDPLITEKALYCIGRTAATADLNLEAAGLEADERGQLEVDEGFCTKQPGIMAAGDVIGFPSLASTAMMQGRMAASSAFGGEIIKMPSTFPIGIYTIPEISYFGQTEQQLHDDGTAYEIGRAGYREIARGPMIGDTSGLLKLIFDPETRKMLGTHIIGAQASDLVHVGMVAQSLGASLDYFADTVFNYPTLAEGYKIAAFNGINRLKGLKASPSGHYEG
jgi:NAD(P) transhydrogenase